MNFLTKNIKIISICLFVLVALTAFFLFNNKDTQKNIFTFDTFISINLNGKNSSATADKIESVLLEMEKEYSKYRTDSVVSQFNSSPEGEKTKISDEMANLILRCSNISSKTGDAFDITTSALSDLWQVKTATAPPSSTDIELAIKKTGYKKISLDENALLKTDAEIDFGGVLKGYAADKIRNIAQENGIKSGIVNLGGNVCLIGSKNGKPWTVGIVNPFEIDKVYLTVEVENTNVITSGAYQRYFESGGKIYHHILSPETGYPAESDLASVTVISPDGTLADALSTAIFVQGSKKGLETAKQFGIEVIMIKKDGSIIATDSINYTMRDN